MQFKVNIYYNHDNLQEYIMKVLIQSKMPVEIFKSDVVESPNDYFLIINFFNEEQMHEVRIKDLLRETERDHFDKKYIPMIHLSISDQVYNMSVAQMLKSLDKDKDVIYGQILEDKIDLVTHLGCYGQPKKVIEVKDRSVYLNVKGILMGTSNYRLEPLTFEYMLAHANKDVEYRLHHLIEYSNFLSLVKRTDKVDKVIVSSDKGDFLTISVVDKVNVLITDSNGRKIKLPITASVISLDIQFDYEFNALRQCMKEYFNIFKV